jgi:hypothetical protein
MLTYDNTQSLYYYTGYTYEVENPEDGSILSYSYYRYDYSTGIHSQLTQLVIGKNVSIGSYAFAGNANLESVTLGENAQIGDYAFFNDAALTSIDLSKVSTIGEYAFSGSRTQDYWCYNNTYTYAYSYETIGGKLTPVNYVYSSLAPVFTSVDLSNATYIGSGAFAFNDKLTTVVLSENLQNIEASTFAFCTSIKAITLPKNIIYVGDYAFYNTSLETIDLSNIKEIGNYAFGRTPLKSVTLKEGAELGDNAFAYCTKLATVTGLNKVNKIGAYAFIGVALEDISLNASYVGDYAFAQSSVKTVKLGEQVAEFGENPFYACQIETFGKLEEVKFNDKVVKQEIQSTYDVSNTVKVINGVLYQVVPNGLELVSYPILSEDTQFTVEEGTVRISARAFVGANLQSITLPASMQAIGDKAFYNCDDLAMVVFTSYNAPILEEEYDSTYANQSNMPFTGYYGEFTGLGITPYYMWNASTNANDFYYGANFVNYIGHLSSKLVMVRPSNGQGYDTFILSQYFGVKVDGSNAATTSTEMVIALIDALPSTITLSNENDIIAARLAYDSIPSVEQQALVTNYSVLVDAETKLEYLKYKNSTNETPIEIEEPEPSAFVTFLQNNMVGLIIAVVLLLCVVGLVVYIIIDKKKNKSNN